MLTYLDKKCVSNHIHVESEDYTPEIIDAIRVPSSQLLVALHDSRNGSFAMDHVMSCVDISIDQIVTSTTRPHCASHLLTFPRTCEIPLCDVMIPIHGSRDVLHYEIDDDFLITVDTIIEASNEDDSDDVSFGLVHVDHSLVVDEVNIDRHDVYVEVLWTFPCVPAFPLFAAVCVQGLAVPGSSSAENPIRHLRAPLHAMAAKPRPDDPLPPITSTDHSESKG
jgi:hypothetical protein